MVVPSFFLSFFLSPCQFPVTTSLLRRATARHGVKMDDPQSAKQIQKFIETYGVNVDEVELEVNKQQQSER